MALQQRVRPAVGQVHLTTSTPKQDLAALTLQQSSTAVKTLVDTSIGCIMYLRGIFPEDHFEEVVLPSGRPMTTDEHGRTVKVKGDGSIKVKKLKRSCSSECDRLLDYWERGVQEALDKQYLRSLIIAVSLDPDDLTNIVEAYTFNFKYESIERSKARAPIMELTAKLNGIKMGNNTFQINLPAEHPMPTARDVRSSAQSIIRNLITMTSTLQELPRRRFITLKIIYNDSAPADYEPPHFKAADPNKHRFIFGTKTMQEGPDESTFGTMETGHQSVSIHVASLADALPLPLPIGQNVDCHSMSARADLLREENAVQRQDAEQRRVIWDAEETAHEGVSDGDEDEEHSSDRDADGEVDPEHHTHPSFAERQAAKEREERLGLRRGYRLSVPVGVRMGDGKIAPVPVSAVDEATRREEARNKGLLVDDDDLRDVEMFVSKVIRKELEAEKDTNSDLLQNVFTPRRHGSLQSTLTVARAPSVAKAGTSAVDASKLNSLAKSGAEDTSAAANQNLEKNQRQDDTIAEDVEMTNAMEAIAQENETSAVTPSKGVSESASRAHTHASQAEARDNLPNGHGNENGAAQPRVTGGSTVESSKNQSENHVVPPSETEAQTRCACDDNEDDGLMIQCTACACWVHAACYGIYTSKQIKKDFKCYADRPALFKAPDDDRKEKLSRDLQALAHKRKALHIMYDTDKAWPESINKLANKIGTTVRNATALRNELESDGFLRKATPQSDPHLFTSARSASSQKRSKGRSRKAASVQLVIVQTATLKKNMRSLYFNPNGGKEAVLFAEYGAAVSSGMEKAPDDSHINEEHAKNTTTLQDMVLSGQNGATLSMESFDCAETARMEAEMREEMEAASRASGRAHEDGLPSGELQKGPGSEQSQRDVISQKSLPLQESQRQNSAASRVQSKSLLKHHAFKDCAKPHGTVRDCRMAAEREDEGSQAALDQRPNPERQDSRDIYELIDETMVAPESLASQAPAQLHTPQDSMDSSKTGSQGKRAAPPDFCWPRSKKKISLATAIEIQDESGFVEEN